MNKYIKYYILSLLCVFCLGSNAQMYQEMTLQQCIDQALQQSLLIKQSKLSADKARTLQATAFDVEKTTLALRQDPTSGGSPDNGISISQSFDFPTLYTARHKYLKAQTAVANSEIAIAENELIFQVKSNYYALLHAIEVLRQLQKQDSIYCHFLVLSTARHDAGETNNLEQMNALKLQSENYQALLIAESNVRKIGFTLQQLLNTDVIITPADKQLSPLTFNAETQTAFASTPWGNSYEKRMDSSRRNVQLARQAFMPDINVGFTTQVVIKGFNPYNVDRSRFSKGNLMAFEVGVSVPLFFGSQKAKLKAARKEVELLQNERLMAERQQQQQQQIAQNELKRTKRALAYYTTEALQRAQSMLQISQANYESGEISYVEYVQNLTSALDVEMRHIDAINDFNQAVIQFNYINGQCK